MPDQKRRLAMLCSLTACLLGVASFMPGSAVHAQMRDQGGGMTGRSMPEQKVSDGAPSEPGKARPRYPVVDTHSHIESHTSLASAVAAAADVVQRVGITHVVLMSPPRPGGKRIGYEADDLLSATRDHRGMFSVAAGGDSLNRIIHSTNPQSVTQADRESFRRQAEKLAELNIAGFGEIAVRHLSLSMMGSGHPFEDMPADHPLLLELADVAAAKGLPVDMHLDLAPEDMGLPPRPVFNAITPSRLKENRAGFERLLAHNRSAKIIWAHAGSDPLGTRNPALQRELLSHHPNLYMSIRIGRSTPSPDTILTPSTTIKPGWLKLLQDFPDRFVLGSDLFHTAGSMRGPGEENLKAMVLLLDQLPDEVAQKIAYKNAETLFRLKLAKE